MASQAAIDFLTKEIKISNNIVTFRLLSRELSIHVNDAKQQLELFHTSSKQGKDPVFATYVLSGIAAPEAQSEVLSKSACASSSYSSEETPKRLITLVSEENLEAAKSRFVGTPSQHVHSLSSGLLKEPGLLTSVAERVRQLDKQNGQEHAAQIGMLLSKEAHWFAAPKSKPRHNIDNSTKANALAAKLSRKDMNLGRTSSKSDVAQAAKEPTRQNTLSFFGASKKTDTSGSKQVAQDTIPKAMDTV
ncbi:hypothetical protein FRC12_006849 [Ceratobasidium sp. 428]|nr:hypothetical protein FRC12_006849 [Ceratobasidium sp. 428]